MRPCIGARPVEVTDATTADIVRRPTAPEMTKAMDRLTQFGRARMGAGASADNPGWSADEVDRVARRLPRGSL